VLADRYRIERELGAGGMATVYLAHDLRHDRKVALKVLRPELSAILGAERFLAEIRTTANLQHPHILALHDSGEADGTVFYVMPYVEGESLRDWLNREKQLPVEDAVRIAAEVAGALDYAHRHGVIHRDIKPENIMVHEGSALVADFGIALAVSRSDGGSRMTETGMSLGTPHYMAPEQAMGEREISPRADIYALGCVLYETLTAEPPFSGATAQAIIARVLTETPRSLTLQRHTIPPHVEAAVEKALEKLPADRFATAAQFAEALMNPGYMPQSTRRAVAIAGGRDAGWRARLAVPLAVVAVVAVVGMSWALLRSAPAAPVNRFGLSLPVDQAPQPGQLFALSPDGSRLAYVGPGPRGGQVWIKARDRYDAFALSGTDAVTNFTFSPDGEWIAFVQGNQLKKLQVTGGAAITLADSVSGAPGLAWVDNGTLVHIAQGQRSLRRIPDVGGTPETIWRSDSSLALFPTPLPGGRGVLFVNSPLGSASPAELLVVDLKGGEAHLVQAGVILGLYAPTGHVIYVRPDGALLALGFDLGGLRARGAPVPIRDSIVVVNGVLPLVALSREGTLALRTGAATILRSQMVWVDRTGRETRVDSTWTFRHVVYGGNAGWSLSPDGTRLAIGLNTEAGDNIWVKQLPAGPEVRVTFDSASEYRPRWMPDGRSVLFGSNRVPGTGLYRRAADGTGRDSLLLAGAIFEGEVSWDGRWLLARAGGAINQPGARNIGALGLGVDTALTPLVDTPFDESEIALSPDGQWLAYVSDETSRPEVFIRPFPTTETAKYQVSTSGGVAPLWARSGRELFFVNLNREMVVVPVAPGPALRLGEQSTLFLLGEDLYLTAREFYTPFDISPDGQRFIMARHERTTARGEAPLIITQNWFAELRRQLGGR
jgi:serine/threonine-protein kinase